MNRKFISIAMAAAICVSALAIPAYASELTEKDGKIYCVQENGSYATGWQKINGKYYYFDKNGEAVTKNSVIGKVRCDFGPDGVFKGKYTGWTTAGGRKFYYADGIKQTGWYYYKDNWYYFDESDGSMVTGTVTIDGIEQTFSDKGIWEGKQEINFHIAIYNAGKIFSPDDYGGAYYDNETLVILSVNDENIRKIAGPLKKKYPQIVLKHCKFSAAELESVRSHIDKMHQTYEISGWGISTMENCVSVITEQVNSELQEYIDSLEDPSIVRIEIGKIIPV